MFGDNFNCDFNNLMRSGKFDQQTLSAEKFYFQIQTPEHYSHLILFLSGTIKYIVLQQQG